MSFPRYLFILILTCLLGRISNGQEISSQPPIPERIQWMADSICKTRKLCDGTEIKFLECRYFPISTLKKPGVNKPYYYFEYAVDIKKGMHTDLTFSITDDYSIEFISGMPDILYVHSPCDILSLEALWAIARQNGLKAKLNTSHYNFFFDEDGIFIWINEKRSRWDVDTYIVNATTGQLIKHCQANVKF
jgi:hypothetical protein